MKLVFLKIIFVSYFILFFNFNLIAGFINKNKNTLVFIDNFINKIISLTIIYNLYKIRAIIISYLENWIYESDIVFNSQKTIFIQFIYIYSKVSSLRTSEKLVLLSATVTIFYLDKDFMSCIRSEV